MILIFRDGPDNWYPGVYDSAFTKHTGIDHDSIIPRNMDGMIRHTAIASEAYEQTNYEIWKRHDDSRIGSTGTLLAAIVLLQNY